MMVTVALNLQQTTTVAHHSIIAERTLRFQAEDFLHPPQTWFATMKSSSAAAGRPWRWVCSGR